MPEATTSREAILNRIRTANTTAKTTAHAAESQTIDRAYQQATALDRETILKIFLDHLHEYDARVFEAKPDTLAATIAEVLKSSNQKSAIVSDDFPARKPARWLHLAARIPKHKGPAEHGSRRNRHLRSSDCPHRNHHPKGYASADAPARPLPLHRLRTSNRRHSP